MFKQPQQEFISCFYIIVIQSNPMKTKDKLLLEKYVQGSWDLNMILCGKRDGVDLQYSAWARNQEDDIQAFHEMMKRISTPVKETCITLYRGTANPSPTIEPLAYEMRNCQYLSTTWSRKIAKEFNFKSKGMLHVLHVQKGVRIFDTTNKTIYDTDLLSMANPREKEVILLPGCHLKMISLIGQVITWKVTI